MTPTATRWYCKEHLWTDRTKPFFGTNTKWKVYRKYILTVNDQISIKCIENWFLLTSVNFLKYNCIAGCEVLSQQVVNKANKIISDISYVLDSEYQLRPCNCRLRLPMLRTNTFTLFSTRFYNKFSDIYMLSMHSLVPRWPLMFIISFVRFLCVLIIMLRHFADVAQISFGICGWGRQVSW